MEKPKISRRLVLGGAVLGLGAINMVLFAWRNRHSLEPSQLPPRGPLRLPSSASSTPSGEDKDICSITFSLLGNHLLCGGANDELSIWDPATEQCLASWNGPPRKGFAGIGFSSNNSWLATVSPYRGVKFWTPGKTKGSGEVMFKEVTYTEYAFHPTCVAFKPPLKDGATESSSVVALALGDNSIRILIYDPSKRALPKEVLALRTNDPRALNYKVPGLFAEATMLRGHTEQINAVSFSRDGKLLASASEDQTVRVWDTHSWQQLALLNGHTSGVNSVAFSKKGDRLASASNDRNVTIWDMQKKDKSGILSGHSDAVLNAVFCGKSDWLASTSVDRKMLLWPLEGGIGKAHQLGDNPGNYAAIDVSTDGQYLAASWGSKIKFWKTSAVQSEAKRELGIA